MTLYLVVGATIDEHSLIVKAVDLNNGRTYLQTRNASDDRVIDEGDVDGSLIDGHTLRVSMGLAAIEVKVILPKLPVDKQMIN
jgi:hypothetical protein